MFSAESFARLVTDPLGKKKVLTPAEEKVEREEGFAKSMQYKKIKEQGAQIGINTETFEKVLQGIDDDTMQEILDEIRAEKKGH